MLTALLGALAFVLLQTTTVVAEVRVFVTNEKSNDVTVIDTAANAVVKKIAVPKNPRGMRFTPDSRRLLVASEQAHEVSAIDVTKLEVERSVKTGGSRPVDVAITADGARAYVSHGQS